MNLDVMCMSMHITIGKIVKVKFLFREYCDRSGGWSIYVDLYNELPDPTDRDTDRNR